MTPPRRNTRIVATLGPATSDPAMIDALVAGGVDVVRLNCSHGTQALREQLISDVRAAADRAGRSVAILLDIQGPKIRTGNLVGGQAVDLISGAQLTITIRPVDGDANMISTNYQALPRDVRVGSRILLSDGAIELEVEAIEHESVHCRVVAGGRLTERQGINLPGVPVSAPALTEKDESDLEHGLRQGVDFVALSFVRRPDDLRHIKRRIRDLGYRTPVIAKIEKPDAVADLEAIIAQADGVMVARGDLGVELPLDQVPVIQKRIARIARARRIPTIVATQMLESMITNERPTRAEVSDVANAIFESVDAVMLSGETAVGRYPLASVLLMGRIAATAESPVSDGYRGDLLAAVGSALSQTRARTGRSVSLAHAAVVLAADISASAIVAITQSGFTARLVSSMRPRTPIYAVTDDVRVQRSLALCWGVTAIVEPFQAATGALVERIERRLLTMGAVEPGACLVILGGGPTSPRGRTSFLRLHDVKRVKSEGPG